MSFPIKSIFEQIAVDVFKMKDVVEAKAFTKAFVLSKDINEKDKKLIIQNVEGCKNIYKLHVYITNALLKYEGLSLNGKEKKKEQPEISQTEGQNLD